MHDRMELSARMQMNAGLVPEKATVADIGCDHGYVAMVLVREKRCPKVIAMDVNPGPLSIAQKNIQQSGLYERIQCRLSDGMNELQPGEVDTVLMAGMGGMLICRILQQSPEVLKQVKTLILQPQSDLAEVRKKVFELGFGIEDEQFCLDAEKYYTAIRAVRGRQTLPYTEEEYRYGRILPARKEKRYFQYLTREKEKKEQLLAKLRTHGTGKTRAREIEIRQEIAEIQRVLAGQYGNQ